MNDADKIKMLRELLQFTLRGLASGHIRAKPIMDMSDPEAEEWPIRELGEEIQKTLDATK